MMFDVATFGTSLTWLHYWQNEAARLIARPVQFYNCGHSGMASDWGVANVARVARLRPKAALIEFSMNDADFDAITLAVADTNTTAIINALKGVVPNIFLMTMNPISPFNPANSEHVNRADLPTYYAAYRAIAVREGVGLIDNEPSWAGYQFPDGIHPTEAQAKAVTAVNVAAALRPLVA